MTQHLDLSSTIAEIVDVVGKRQIATVFPEAGLTEIIDAFAGAEHTRQIYVVEHDQQLIGVISLGHMAKHLLFHHSDKAVDNLHLISMATSETAADFIDRPVITAHLYESIEPVLERMLSANIKEIPVLDNHEHLIGDLTLVDILHLCSKEFLNHDSY